MLSHTKCLPSCRQGGNVRYSNTLRRLGEYKKCILKKQAVRVLSTPLFLPGKWKTGAPFAISNPGPL